jgi:TPR repeat protein
MKLHSVALNFLVLTSLSLPPSTAFSVDKADAQKLDSASKLIQEHKYKEGYASFKKMAKKGCPFSQCVIGLMHQLGVGEQRSLTKAAYWFKRSAAQGFVDAERRLGELYLTPEFQNEKKALQHLEIAASYGLAEAEYDLGKFYSEKGGPEAQAKAKLWLQRAGDQGYTDAKELAAKLPAIPQPQNQNTPTVVSNIGTAWTGYAGLTQGLESVSKSQ